MILDGLADSISGVGNLEFNHHVGHHVDRIPEMESSFQGKVFFYPDQETLK